MSLRERLKQLRNKHGLSQAKFAKLIGVSSGNVGDWESGKAAPGAAALANIATAFNISLDWLVVGKEVNPANTENKYVAELLNDLSEKELGDLNVIVEFLIYRREKEGQKTRPPSKKPKSRPPGMEPAAQVKEEDMVYLPVLGESAAGQPIFINEILEGFIPVDKKLVRDKCFIVRAKGDSMTGRGIDDGDLVVIRRQPVVEAGESALVRIGDESTIKYFYRQGDRVVLMSANPKYKPIEIRKPENVAIIGKVIHIIKKEEGEARLRDSQ